MNKYRVCILVAVIPAACMIATVEQVSHEEVDALTGRVAKLEQRMTKLEPRLKGLEWHIKSINKKFISRPNPATVKPRTQAKRSPLPTSKATGSQTIPYSQVRHNEEHLTDIQWDVYSNQIAGSRIKWTGWVDDAQEEFWGDACLVFVDMDSPSEPFSLYDVIITQQKAKALQLTKGRRITFWATIDKTTSFLGNRTVWLKNAKITQW